MANLYSSPARNEDVVREWFEAAKAAGVEIIESGVVSVQRIEGRGRKVTLDNGETLKTQRVMAASAGMRRTDSVPARISVDWVVFSIAFAPTATCVTATGRPHRTPSVSRG